MIRIGLFAGLVLALPAFAAAQTPASGGACNDVEHHRLDFWVGRWTVTKTGEDRVVADSLIEPVYGCGIRENWMPKNHQDGGSLSIYVPAAKEWRQTWIDSSGEYTDYRGGWTGRAMVLLADSATAAGKPMQMRMTYSRGDAGTVRQTGFNSTDGGKTWTPDYDFTYHPVAR